MISIVLLQGKLGISCNSGEAFFVVHVRFNLESSRCPHLDLLCISAEPFFLVQRVLAEAQEIIDKHGPDEGEEQPAAAVKTVDETVADETPNVPRGERVVQPPGGAATTANGEFSFSFFDGNADDAEKCSKSAGADTQQSDSDSSSSCGTSSSSDDEEEVEEEGGASLKAPRLAKKPRKARSDLTGQRKVEAKVRAATVAYERALQVAEVLS